MNRVRLAKLPCPSHYIGVISRALKLFMSYPPQEAYDRLLRSTPKELDIVSVRFMFHRSLSYFPFYLMPFFVYLQFTDKQKQLLESTLLEKGGLDTYEASLRVGRPAGDTVRYYRIFKEDALRAYFANRAASPSLRTLPPKPSLFGANAHLLEESDLLYKEVTSKTSCSSCGTRTSLHWWTMLRASLTGVYCESCKAFFLRYAQVPNRPLKTDEVARAKSLRRESPPAPSSRKRAKVSIILSCFKPRPNWCLLPHFQFPGF